MPNTLIQFRIDESSRIKALNICKELGIDLQTYLRLCMSRLILENGIPFSMKLNNNQTFTGIEAMKEASKIAEKNGISDMTLDEINLEINEARKLSNI